MVTDYKDLSLIDWLSYILSDYFSPSDTRRGIEAGLGHEITTQVTAKALFGVIYEKFNQCSEKERRNIVRSDIEFVYILKTLIIRCSL